MTNLTGYLIDPTNRTISQITIPNYKMRQWLPHGPTIGMVYPNGDVLYVDDEGLLSKITCAFRIKARRDGQPMVSNGILTGRDHCEIVNNDLVETTLPPAFSMAELGQAIEWLTVPEALQWFEAQSDKPALTINGDVVMTWADYLPILKGEVRHDNRI